MIISLSALSLGLGSVACTEAYEEDQASSAELAPPAGQGWLDVAPGVWQRELADGSIETYTVGTAGLQWVMPHLEEAGDMLEQAYLQEPTQERWEQLMGHELMMDEARQTLAEPAKAPQDHEQIAKCDISYSHTANAYPLSPGVKATANSSYYNNCGYSGGVYTYAYAKINTVQQVNSCGWRYGASTSCNSTSYLTGSGSTCYSKGIAKVTNQTGYTYTSIKENFSCGSSGGGGGGGICEIDPASCNCGPGTPYQCP